MTDIDFVGAHGDALSMALWFMGDKAFVFLGPSRDSSVIRQ